MKLEKITARGAEGLYRESSTKIIYFRQFRKGRGEIKVSTRTTLLDAAKTFRDALIQKSGGPKKKNQRRTALEMYDQWVDRKRAQDKSAGTITSMVSSRNFFAKFFDSMMPDEITSEWWDLKFIPQTRYLKFKPVKNKETGVWEREEVVRKTPRKFYNDHKWLTAYLEQCLEDRLIVKVPKIENPDPERDPGKVYTDDEIDRLLLNSQNEDLYLAILMGATMGMRRGEIFKLRSDRVDLKARMIRLRKEDTKIRKARSFAISPDCWELISARARAGEWIFPSKSVEGAHLHIDGYMTAWKNLKAITGITGRFHFLRHTFLTKAFRAPGANAALICFYAGLSLEVAQKVYLHFDDEDTREVAGLVSYVH